MEAAIERVGRAVGEDAGGQCIQLPIKAWMCFLLGGVPLPTTHHSITERFPHPADERKALTAAGTGVERVEFAIKNICFASGTVLAQRA